MWRPPLRFALLLVLSLALLPLALASRLLALCRVERTSLRMAAAVQRLWARGILAVLDIEVVVEGARPDRPCLVVANHLSYLDIAVLSAYFPGRFVAKSDIAGWPALG